MPPVVPCHGPERAERCAGPTQADVGAAPDLVGLRVLESEREVCPVPSDVCQCGVALRVKLVLGGGGVLAHPEKAVEGGAESGTEHHAVLAGNLW